MKLKTKKTPLLSFFFLSALFGLLLAADAVQAREITMKFQVPIPGMEEEIAIEPDSIGKYIKAVYNYLIGSVGILATVVIMYAGVLWITAAGSAEQVGKAKSYMASSLTGLILALFSWTILWTINPDLISFKPITIKETVYIPDPTIGCCQPDNTKDAYASIQDECEESGSWDAEKVVFEGDCIDKNPSMANGGCCVPKIPTFGSVCILTTEDKCPPAGKSENDYKWIECDEGTNCKNCIDCLEID